MSILKKWILFCPLVIFWTCASLFADTIILKDESVLNGEILERKKGAIIFKSVHGIFTIQLSKIKSIIEDKNEIPQQAEPVRFKIKKYTLGLILGYGLSTLETDVIKKTGYKDPSPQYLGSYSIASSFNYYLVPFLSLQGALSFDHKKLGVIWKRDTESSDYEEVYTFNFLTLSLGGRIYFKDLIYGGLGFSYGFILGSPQIQMTGPNINQKKDVSSLSQDAKTSGSFSSYLELGVLFSLSRDWLMDLNVKVEGSFSPIYKSSQYPASRSWNISPRSYLFLIGIHYLL